MKRRARLLAAAALLLLAAGAWLSAVGDATAPPPARPRADVEFPHFAREADHRRAKERRTVVVPAAIAAPAGAGEAAPAPRRRDPLLLAVPAGAGVLVLEANALRHSRLGELLVACARREGEDPLARLRDDTGIDPLKDLDRIALAGDVVLASGFFDRARFDALAAAAEPYGAEATIYRTAPAADSPVVARWRDQLLLFGGEQAVRRALDQVEGRVPAPPQAVPDDLTYGEAYGVFEGEALRRAVGGASGELQELFRRAASRVELHADAMRDVAVTVSVSGSDAAAVRDLAKAAAGALAAARVDASLRKDAELAELLELAAVRAAPQGFALDVAVPEATLVRWFAHCLAPPAESGPGSPARNP